MNTVEVFKTNVCEPTEAERMVRLLRQHFPFSRINIDLHDIDKVLRLEGKDFTPGKVTELLMQEGFQCALLED